MLHRVLNVGGGDRRTAIPRHFNGWTHHILDIDPRISPDVLGDARELASLVPAGSYDAIYCSHNIEHYYPHDVPKVLAGFHHALKPDGFAHIRCPDMGAVFAEIARRGLDIEDALYESTAGPIMVRDVIYGYGVEIERSGVDFYAHKTGFTKLSLARQIKAAGFKGFIAQRPVLELVAFAFMGAPTEEQKRMLDEL